MKHLRKFNEDIESNKLDHEYIKNCFIEFIDNGCDIDTELDRTDLNDFKPWKNPIYVKDEEFEVSSYIIFSINEINIHDNDDIKYNFYKYKENINLLNELLLDINTSIDKVKLKYPDIKFHFDAEDCVIVFYI